MTKPVSRKMAVDCLLYSINAVFHGLTCYICHQYLMPEQDIQFDHRHAIVHLGPHEYQNLRAVHKDCHKRKTAQDIKANAKINRITGKTKGRPKTKWAKRKMQSHNNLRKT